MVTMILLVIAMICFLLGALGVAASVNWDLLGKAFVVAAATAYAGKV